MSKGLTLGIIMLAAAAAALAVTMALLMMNTALVKQAFATGGQCGTCASSFTPKSLSSGLSGSGENGAEKVFAPGQEAQATGGSASNFSPGHEKP
jgi:hypothetical protein